MSNIRSIYAAIEYIEDHLQERVAVADVAEAVSYSLYHFCRTFNQVVHHSPYDYLMRRRLSESARELLSSERRIIDVALDYQFNSPETYSRAFKRMFGLQPSQWKKRGRLDERRLMAGLTLAHIEHRNRGDCLKPVIVEKGALCLVGLMTHAGGDPVAVQALWSLLARELARVEGPDGPARHYGLDWQGGGRLEGGRFYLAAVEGEPVAAAASALVTKRLPPSTYARFVHKGPAANLVLTWDYVFHTWLPKSGRNLAYPWLLECYGPHPRVSEDEELEIGIMVPIQ